MHKRNRFFAFSAFFLALGALIGCGGNQLNMFYSVIFEYNSDGTRAITDKNGDYRTAKFVKPNECVEKPDMTSLVGAEPTAWCTDESLTQEFNFSTPITTQTHLYARWINPEAEITGVKFTSAAKEQFSDMLQYDLCNMSINGDMWTTIPAGSDKWDNLKFTVDNTDIAEWNSTQNTIWAKGGGDTNVTISVAKKDDPSTTFTDTIPIKVIDKDAEGKAVVPVTKIVATPNGSTTVDMGEAKEVARTASVTITGKDGKDATNTDFYYILDVDESVATVTREGNTLTITFYNDGKGSAEQDVNLLVVAKSSDDGTYKTSKITYTVTKTTHIQTITLEPTSLELFYSDSGYGTTYSESLLTATINPTSPTDPNLKWESSNTLVSIIGEDNLSRTISAGKTPDSGGTTTANITVTPNDPSSTASAICPVTVVLPPTKMNFSSTPKTEFEVDETANAPTIEYSNTKVHQNAKVSDECKVVTWSSSDTSVATVDAKTGKVTAIKGGTAKITATYSYKNLKEVESISYYITVITHVKSLILNKAKLLMVYADSNLTGGLKEFQLTAKPSPEVTPAPTIEWSCHENAAVSVDSNGKVTTKKATTNELVTTTITATTYDGTKPITATCTVQVVLPVESMSFTKTPPNYLVADDPTSGIFQQAISFDKVGEKKDLEPTLECRNDIEWSSTNETIAKVDNSGLVTAEKGGTTTISAKTNYKYEGIELPSITISNPTDINVAHQIKKAIKINTNYVFLAGNVSGLKETTLTASVTDTDGNPIEKPIGLDIEWDFVDEEPHIAAIEESADKLSAKITASSTSFGTNTIKVTIKDQYGTTGSKLITIQNYNTTPTPEKINITSAGAVSVVEGSIDDVNIPAEKDGKTATSIADYGFEYSFISNVLMPSTITSIGEGAFYDCFNLEMALFSPNATNELTKIGDYAFYKPSDESITGTKLSYVGLEYCTKLTSIGASAFANQVNLLEITIPTNVTEIKEGAFSNCPSLKTVTVDSKWAVQQVNPGNLFSALSSGKKTVKVHKDIVGYVNASGALAKNYTKSVTPVGNYYIYTQI